MKKTREEIIEEYKALPFVDRQLIRQGAADRLKLDGFEEIGTSDISNTVVHIYNDHGSFENYLEDLIASPITSDYPGL